MVAMRRFLFLHLSMLDELAPIDRLSHRLERCEVVVHAILFPFTTFPGRVTAPKTELMFQTEGHRCR